MTRIEQLNRENARLKSQLKSYEKINSLLKETSGILKGALEKC